MHECAVCVVYACVHMQVYTRTVTLGTVLPATAHFLCRSDPCSKTGRKKLEKSLGVSATDEADKERGVIQWTHTEVGIIYL